MTSYISESDNFDQKVIRPVTSKDLEGKKFKKSSFSQPMPRDNESKIVSWALDLVRESYDYKKELHERWHKNLLDYYQVPTIDSSQRAGQNNQVDEAQDTEIMVPALIKRYVDLGANWIVRETYKSEPFMQFTSYAESSNTRKAQKLYERKIQGDTEYFGARQRSTELGIDLFLYGNAVAKTQFTQDRLLAMEIPELEFNMDDEEEYDPLALDFDDEEDSRAFDVKMDKPYPSFQVIDQYSEFKPVFLGHFFIDPIPPDKDWRKAGYMGDFEFVTAEELVERYGAIPGFTAKLEANPAPEESCLNQVPGIGSSDSFLRSWSSMNDDYGSDGANKSRSLHSVLHLYTKYTETCIVDGSIVVYHRYRAKEVAKAGAFPYILFKMPTASGQLFSSGFGHILRTLQLEQIILASKRLKGIEDINRTYYEYVEGSVDDDIVRNIGGVDVLCVTQPGAVREIAPNHGAVDMFLNAESRNFERAREYAGIPGILDSSNTKTHLGAVSQRMEASQVQFDVILETVRDGFKELFQKMHVYNMAFLQGSVPIKGSTTAFDTEYNDNILSEEELMLLSTEPDLGIKLNLGVDVGAEKLKGFAAVMNTQPAGMILQMLIQQGTLSQEKLLELGAQMFSLGGLSEFAKIFEVDPNQMAMMQQQQAQAQQPQGMPGQGAPQPPQQGNMPPQMPM